MPSGNQPDLCPEMAGQTGLGSVGDEQARPPPSSLHRFLALRLLGWLTPQHWGKFPGRPRGPVQKWGHVNLMSSVQLAYLACDILQDGLCHLGENIHNMMCLEVLVVNMPK